MRPCSAVIVSLADVAERIFDARVSRDELGWFAVVVNLPGAHTWAPTRDQLSDRIDEVIRLVADLSGDENLAVRLLDAEAPGDEDLNR